MRNMFDTVEMCDKHFNEKTFGNIEKPINKDSETVVNVDVDNVGDDNVNIETETINENDDIKNEEGELKNEC